MSRFNSEAYDKLFPREADPIPVETVVSTFTPTTDKLEGTDPDQEKVKKEVPVVPDLEAEADDGGEPDGDGCFDKPDSE